MKNIKVTFYAEDENCEGAEFTGIFRTEYSLKSFVNTYQYAPGYCLFYYDVFEDNCIEGWPIITNTPTGFVKLMQGLFPDMKVSQIKRLTNK
jgi:hypothetical protein